MYDRFFPDVVLDGLDALNELIHEVYAPISGRSYGEPNPHPSCTEGQLKQQENENDDNKVEDSCGSDLLITRTYNIVQKQKLNYGGKWRSHKEGQELCPLFYDSHVSAGESEQLSGSGTGNSRDLQFK